MKSTYQMQFEQQVLNLQTSLGIFAKKAITKYSDSDVIQFQKKLKDLQNLYDKIQVQMKSKKGNIQDVKQKLKRYLLDLDKLQNMVRNAQQSIDNKLKQNLFNARNKQSSNTPLNQIQLKNFQKSQDNQMRLHGIGRQAQEVYDVTNNTNVALYHQRGKLGEIDDDAKGAQQQLGTIDQLTRILKNRDLITKLILLLLVVFLGLADIIVLCLKIL